MIKNPLHIWDNKYESEDEARWTSQWRLGFYDWAMEHVRQDGVTVLDVGSGPGYGLRHLCGKNPTWEATGIDFSSIAVKKAVIPVIQSDIIKDPIEKKYDYVLCVQTLEHIADPAPVVRKMLGAARRQLIITVPFQEDVSEHELHEFSFDKDFFRQFGNPWFQQRFKRLKVVYGFKMHERLRYQTALLLHSRLVSPGRLAVKRLVSIAKSIMSVLRAKRK